MREERTEIKAAGRLEPPGGTRPELLVRTLALDCAAYRKIRSRMAVSATESSREPRQPRRLEKKKNTPAVTPDRAAPCVRRVRISVSKFGGARQGVGLRDE